MTNGSVLSCFYIQRRTLHTKAVNTTWQLTVVHLEYDLREKAGRQRLVLRFTEGPKCCKIWGTGIGYLYPCLFSIGEFN